MARVKAEVAPLWEEWLGICDQAHQSDKAYATFLQQLAGTGWLAPTEAGTNFLRAVVDLAISAATAGGEAVAASGGKLPLAIEQLDALSKLVLVMVKAAEGPAPTPAQAAQAADAKPKAQMALLTRVLAAVIAHLVKSYDTRPFDFNQRALLPPLLELALRAQRARPGARPDPAAGARRLRPRLLGAAALAPPRLCVRVDGARLAPDVHAEAAAHTRGSAAGRRCSGCWSGLFKFLRPYLSSSELLAPVRMLYRGGLRVLLVLLHDFPEFLCDYHFSLCDVIPPSCIQMRNLILSAFPRNMRLPDPFTPNLKVDLLPEISQPPRILSSYSTTLPPGPAADGELAAHPARAQPVPRGALRLNKPRPAPAAG